MSEEVTEKKTVRKLPKKLFVCLGYSIEDGKVKLDDKLDIIKSTDLLIERLTNPEYTDSHKIYTITADDLYGA